MAAPPLIPSIHTSKPPSEVDTTAVSTTKVKMPERLGEALTEPRRKLYLNALRSGDTISEACKAAGVKYSAVQWARTQGYFEPGEEAEAYAEGTSVLEQIATIRGRDGVEDIQLYQGEVCYHRELVTITDPISGEEMEIFALKKDDNGQPIPIVKRQYSDQLLKFVLGARDPSRFRDQRHEVTGAGGGPVEHRIVVEFVE